MEFKIKLTKTGGAGMYEIESSDNGITTSLVLKLSNGQPYYYARLEAERLAVALNCNLVENDMIIRETITKEIRDRKEQ